MAYRGNKTIAFRKVPAVFASAAARNQPGAEPAEFEVGALQPIIPFDFPSGPGGYFGHHKSGTCNPRVDLGSEWQVPPGVTFDKASLLKYGAGLDSSAGARDIGFDVDRDHAWQLKFDGSCFFN